MMPQITRADFQPADYQATWLSEVESLGDQPAGMYEYNDHLYHKNAHGVITRDKATLFL